MSDSKQKADECVAKLQEAAKDFPSHLMFLSSQEYGGFVYGNFEASDTKMAAVIVDMLQNNEDMFLFLQKIMEYVKTDRKGSLSEFFTRDSKNFKNEIHVKVDYSQEHSIIISKPNSSTTDSIDDMATLCEALCTLIHAADKRGQKNSAASLRSCIHHLEHGFADASYKVETRDK